jgi:uncharacterized hydrophobic protein (TIGR00271 family)
MSVRESRLSNARGGAILRTFLATMARDVDHEEVGGRVLDAGRIGGGYVMMTAISAAIAVLGLLLSSPAVVIGAMLLSPLMGPIILLGFSFWTVDWPSTRKALASLGVGFGIALAVSVVLTLLSPLKEPTAEILARAHPTLFDLLVAIFSGIAGGYAVIRQRGETVIGVAIATALMPPLAVVGFGVGTGAWSIAGGALLLFFTNLLAIALAAAIMAALNGFRPHVSLTDGAWMSHLAVLLILAALCVPLTLGLRTIAREGRATVDARAEVARLFGRKARIASLSVRTGKDGLEVDGLVATQAFVRGAPAKLANDLRKKLNAPVRVSLDQIVVADPRRLEPRAAPAPGEASPDSSLDAAKALRAAVPFAGAVTSYDPSSNSGLVLLGANSGLDLAGARALEAALARTMAGSTVRVIPPLQPLPTVAIVVAKSAPATLGPTDLQSWALSRWRAGAVEARICRGGRPGVRTRDVVAALKAAFAPLTVDMAPSSADCGRGVDPPFVSIAPAPAPAPAVPAG